MKFTICLLSAAILSTTNAIKTRVATQQDATIDATTTDCDTRFDAVTNLKYFWDWQGEQDLFQGMFTAEAWDSLYTNMCAATEEDFQTAFACNEFAELTMDHYLCFSSFQKEGVSLACQDRQDSVGYVLSGVGRQVQNAFFPMFTSEEEDELDAKYCELAFEDWTAFYGCIFSVERDAADGADQLWDCYELYINTSCEDRQTVLQDILGAKINEDQSIGQVADWISPQYQALIDEAICALKIHEYKDAQECMTKAATAEEMFACLQEIVDDADMDEIFTKDFCQCRNNQFGDILETKSIEVQDAFYNAYDDIAFDALGETICLLTESEFHLTAACFNDAQDYETIQACFSAM